jgi:hypothetical protein
MERALDFWIGTWDCTWDGGRGTNRIGFEMDGRVLVERFEALAPDAFSGMSVSVFDPAAGWRQTWVDSNGSYWHFVGRAGAGTFTFATPDRVDAEQLFKRMVFSRIGPDGFDWRWESSPDEVTWTRRWTIRYTRRNEASTAGPERP